MSISLAFFSNLCVTRMFVSRNLSTQFLRQVSVLESSFVDGLDPSVQVSQHFSFSSCRMFWNQKIGSKTF